MLLLVLLLLLRLVALALAAPLSMLCASSSMKRAAGILTGRTSELWAEALR
jgi:hypothetical protein